MVKEAAAEPEEGRVLPDPFEIKSIRSVAAPAGMPAADWYRYEICQGHNTIVGYRDGDAETVREAVEMIVLGLNMRRKGGRGRVHIVLKSKASQSLQ